MQESQYRQNHLLNEMYQNVQQLLAMQEAPEEAPAEHQANATTGTNSDSDIIPHLVLEEPVGNRHGFLSYWFSNQLKLHY